MRLRHVCACARVRALHALHISHIIQISALSVDRVSRPSRLAMATLDGITGIENFIRRRMVEDRVSHKRKRRIHVDVSAYQTWS